MADYDLKKAVTKIGSHRMNFALYRGEDADQVLITSKPPGASQVTELEEECGKAKRVLKGICFYEEQKLIFAVKQDPAPAYEMMLTKIFKDRKCGSFLPVILRKLGENESDEVADADATPPPTQTPVPPVTPVTQTPPGTTPSGGPSAAFVARLKALKPAIDQVVAGGGASAGVMQTRLVEVVGFARQKDFANAGAGLDAIEKLLQAPAPPVTGGDPMAEFVARMKKVVPAIAQAVAAHPAAGLEAKQLATTAGAEAKNKNLAHAHQLLDQAEAILQKAAGTAGTGTTGNPTAKPEDGLAAEWQKLFEAMNPGYLEAVRAGALNPEAEKLQSRIKVMWAYATAQAETKAYDKAITTLRNLEKEGLFAQMAQAKTGGSGIPKGLVEKRKFLLERWLRIPGELEAELASLQKQMAAQVPDENAPELGGDLDEYLLGLVDEIQDELDAAIQKGDSGLLKGLKGRVTQDPIVAHLVGNPFVSGSKFQSLMLDALTEIETAMTK